MNYKIRVSSRAIIINEDKILLNCFGNGLYYNFPGGGIEENETAKQAVIREVLEESGLTVDVGELIFSLEYEPISCNESLIKNKAKTCLRNPSCPCSSCSGKHHISFFFRCYINNNILPQIPSHTDINPDDPIITSECKWIKLSDLHDKNILPEIQKPLLDYVKTGVFTPSFWAECEHIN